MGATAGDAWVRERESGVRGNIHVLEGGDEDVAERNDVLVSQVLQQLQLSVCSLSQDRSAERLHDLLDCDILVGELVLGGTAERCEVSIVLYHCAYRVGAHWGSQRRP